MRPKCGRGHPTASGKTLCYNLTVLHELLADPNATALYLFPTKALAHDQLEELGAWQHTLADLDPQLPPLTFAAYDGDTPTAHRATCAATRASLSPIQICCTWVSCPTTPLGPNSSAGYRRRGGRRCTCIEACSAATWPTCCAVYNGSPPSMAARPVSFSPAPPSPTPVNWPNPWSKRLSP
ncbi:MAG: DEAD/DEAH box helicase [Caldilineaceae bacterium]